MSKGAKNNLGCGIFVLASIALGLYVVVLLTGVEEKAIPKNYYKIAFDIETGAMGLKPDSVVRVGGQDSGRVTKLSYQPEHTPPQWIADIWVKKAIPLGKDATVYLETPLLGSVSTVNFGAVGDSAKGAAPEGFVFTGKASPGLLAQAGIDRNDVSAMIKNARDLTATANTALTKVNTKLDPILGNVEDATGNAKDMTADLKNGVKRWTPQLDRTLTNVEHASGELDSRLIEAKELVGAVQGLIDANRPRIDAIAQNLSEIMGRINGETLPQITRVLTQGERAVTYAAEMMQDLRALVREEDPNVRLTLANLRLASDQLKLTLAEVRRNPWRLFYQPGAKELDREMLFEAARTYSASVSELRAATAELEAVSAAARAGGATAPSQAHIDELIAEMKKSYEKYKQSEDLFLKRLLETPPKSE